MAVTGWQAQINRGFLSGILAGRHPPELTIWNLLNRIHLPLDWDTQARRLGVDRLPPAPKADHQTRPQRKQGSEAWISSQI